MSEFDLNPNSVRRSTTDVNSSGNTDDGGSSASSSAPTIDADSGTMNSDSGEASLRHQRNILPDSMESSFYRNRQPQYRQSVDPAMLEDALKNLARNPTFSSVVGTATPPFSYPHMSYHNSNQDLGALAGLYPSGFPHSGIPGQYPPGMVYNQPGSAVALAAAVAAAGAPGLAGPGARRAAGGQRADRAP